jgi:hypothetical protein
MRRRFEAEARDKKKKKGEGSMTEELWDLLAELFGG